MLFHVNIIVKLIYNHNLLFLPDKNTWLLCFAEVLEKKSETKMGCGGESPRCKQAWMQNKIKTQQEMTHALYTTQASQFNTRARTLTDTGENEGKEGTPKGGVLIPFVVINVNWKNELYNMVPCWVIT